ncbi:MAG: NYN domain-containing protein [Candidatus Falkowbacteria bacterium]
MERQFVGLGQQKHQNQRIGVFVDCANIQISAKRVYQSGLNYADILLAATDSRKLAYAIVYCVESEDSEPGAYYEFLRKSGYDVKIKDLKVFRDGSKKGDWDIGICIDVIILSEMLDTVVLVTGDGDFLPLVEYLKNRGKRVEVMSIRETTAGKLIEAADSYQDLGQDGVFLYFKEPAY